MYSSFGGTDGNRWFNDVWIYDPRTNIWQQQDCIGYIPLAREGHASALVGDVMYVLGGRTEEGKDLGDLAAFRITTRRWYTFQNMGPSPSPRSGHGMTAYGNKIVILGGEPSTTPREPAELSLVYILDTTKIKYPIDHPGTRSLTSRRPSVTDRSQTPSGDRTASRQGMREAREAGNGRAKRQGSQESLNSTIQYQRSLDSQASDYPATSGQQRPEPNRVNPGGQSSMTLQNQTRTGPQETRSMSRQGNYVPQSGLDSTLRTPASPTSPIGPQQAKGPLLGNGQYTPKDSFDDGPRELPGSLGVYRQSPHNTQGSMDSINSNLMAPSASNGVARQAMQNAAQPRPNQTHQDSSSASSFAPPQRNDDMAKELETARSKNAWYASELSLARKAGYRSSTSDGSPASRDGEVFAEDEKPLVEALLKMRVELERVQQSLANQSTSAAERIAQIQKERDAAMQEAVYAKARTVANQSKLSSNGMRNTPTSNEDRSDDASRRLASTLAAHNELSVRMQTLASELEAERTARQAAQDSADAAHDRALELDNHRQENASELERLRKELHESQLTARETASNHTEAQTKAEMLLVDKNELSAKLESTRETIRNHNTVLGPLKDAVTASTNKAATLETKLEEERQQRAMLQDQLSQLQAEHDTRLAELDGSTARARNLEDEVAYHKEEARTHREAVLAGFGRLPDDNDPGAKANDQRIAVLQQRLEAANAAMRRNQEAADRAAERSRRAEERITSLESHHEQISREGLSMRKQLQVASRETLALQTERSELQRQLASHRLNSTALQVQHGALKGLLSDRGVESPASTSRNVGADGSLGHAGDNRRLAELESQLDMNNKAHEDMRASFERREMEANRGWEDKLAALDKDYQSAVNYLKGTEKMLGKMKQELHRYKSQNRELEDELAVKRKMEANSTGAKDIASTSANQSAQWEEERNSLRAEITNMQERIDNSVQQLESQMASVRAAQAERDNYKTGSENLQRDLSTHRSDVERLRAQNNTLEMRAAEAEKKIQLLLDTVGTTVNNYRRNSTSAEGMLGGMNMAETNFSSPKNHKRDYSMAESIGGDSLYGGGPGDAVPSFSADNIPTHNPGLSQHNDREAGGVHGTKPSLSHHISRNSLALDNLATELESLRSHWQTTANKHRLSDRSVDLGTANATPTRDMHMHADAGGEPGPSVRNSAENDIDATTPTARTHFHSQSHASQPSNESASSRFQTPQQAPLSASMAEWRKKLDLGDEDGGSARASTAFDDEDEHVDRRTDLGQQQQEQQPAPSSGFSNPAPTSNLNGGIGAGPGLPIGPPMMQSGSHSGPPTWLPGYAGGQGQAQGQGQGQAPYSLAHAAGQAQFQGQKERQTSGQREGAGIGTGQRREQGQNEYALRPTLSNMRGQSGSASEPSSEMDIA